MGKKIVPTPILLFVILVMFRKAEAAFFQVEEKKAVFDSRDSLFKKGGCD